MERCRPQVIRQATTPQSTTGSQTIAQRRVLALTGGRVKWFARAGGKVVLDIGVQKMIELARADVRNIPLSTIAGSEVPGPRGSK